MRTASSRSARHRRKLEPITFDELLATSNMSGFVSFLDIKPGQTVSLPHLAPEALAETSAATEPPPSQDTVSSKDTVASLELKPETSPVREDTVSSQDTVASLSLMPPAAGPSEDTVSSEDTVALLVKPAPPGQAPWRRIRNVRDALTKAEWILFTAMWAHPDAHPTGPDDRFPPRRLAIGYDKLSAASGLYWSAVKRNLGGLRAKLCLEYLAGERSDERVGKTYLIYSLRDAWKRMNDAGLVWVRRWRGSAVLRSEDTVSSLEKTLSSEDTVSSKDTDTVSSEDTDTVSSEDTHMGSSLGSYSGTSSSSAPLTVIHALRGIAPAVDDDAARQLADACRSRAADATDEEIAYFVRTKARQIGRRANVANPLGLLQVAVPKCFEGESFRRFRADRLRQREAAGLAAARRDAETEELRRRMRAVLDDPAAPEEDKRIARAALGEP